MADRGWRPAASAGKSTSTAPSYLPAPWGKSSYCPPAPPQPGEGGQGARPTSWATAALTWAGARRAGSRRLLLGGRESGQALPRCRRAGGQEAAARPAPIGRPRSDARARGAGLAARSCVTCRLQGLGGSLARPLPGSRGSCAGAFGGGASFPLSWEGGRSPSGLCPRPGLPRTTCTSRRCVLGVQAGTGEHPGVPGCEEPQGLRTEESRLVDSRILGVETGV